MPEYREAHEVRTLAEKLITTVHDHLEGERIEYVWRDKAAKKAGKQVLGKARKVSGLNAFLARDDSPTGDDFFVIEIAEDAWRGMDAAQRRALVDHELSHCGISQDDETGETSLVVLPHDCEEFVAVIERHGLWKADVAALVEAGKGVQRLNLVPDISEVIADNAEEIEAELNSALPDGMSVKVSVGRP